MIKETKEGKQYVRTYTDWMDFLALSEKVRDNVDSNGKFNGGRCASVTHKDAKWSGTKTLDEAINLAYRGWPEGRDKIRDTRMKLQIDNLLPNARKIKSTFDVYGDEPDIDRYLEGVPEDMVTLNESISSSSGKVVRISVNRSASCVVETDKIIRKGVAILLAVETLIHLGYSIEIWVSEAVSSYSGYTHEHHIPILHAGDPINLDTIAYMFLHPAVLRRLVFAADECEEHEIRKQFGFWNDGGYGQPSEPIHGPKSDIVMKWSEGLVSKDEDILPFTESILEQVGIRIVDFQNE
jgi:hypothetical protein